MLPLVAALLAPASASAISPPREVVRKMKDAPAVKVKHRARASVVGGTRISIQQAPWAVQVKLYDANGYRGSCSGSIIDPMRIVTAEHCFRDETNAHVIDRAPIVAGSSRFDPRTGAPIAQPGDAPQIVEAVERHFPATYTRGGHRRSFNDLAVVTVDKPLDLSGPSARAIPVVEPGPFYTETPTQLAGFGLQDGTRQTLDGYLYLLPQTIKDYREGCPWTNPGLLEVFFICAVPARTGSVCFGDSGGGLVQGSPPVLLGVLASLGGGFQGEPNACAPGTSSGSTNLASPLHSFIDGRRSRGGAPPPEPPRAPPPPPSRPARPKPSLTMAFRVLGVSRRGVLRLTMRIRGGSGTIAGTLTIGLGKRVVGRTAVRVRSGARAPVRVRLNARARRALRRKRAVLFTARLRAPGGVTATEPIVLPGRRRG